MNRTNRRRRRELRLDRRGYSSRPSGPGRRRASTSSHFAQFIHPDIVWGLVGAQVSRELQQFYEDLVAGGAPSSPCKPHPNSARSTAAEDFIAWVAGRNPDLEDIYASLSDELGVRTTLRFSARSHVAALSAGVRKHAHR